MKKIKEEKGAISVVVLATILFFVTVLTGAYVISATLRKSQIQSELNLKEEYAKQLDYKELDKIHLKMEEKFAKEEEMTILDALKEGIVSIGDYVNYTAPAVTYTVEYADSGAKVGTEDGEHNVTYTELDQIIRVREETSQKMGWRILGYGDNNGVLLPNTNAGIENATRVLLIAANPTPQELVLGQDQLYIQGPTVLDTICELFATGDDWGRSVTVEDINTAYGVTIIPPEYDEFDIIEQGTGVIKLGNTELSSDFWTEPDYEYQVDDYAILNNTMVKLQTGHPGIGTSVNATGYRYETPQTYVNRSIEEMLFDGTYGANTTRKYYLATRAISVGDNNEDSYSDVSFSIGTVGEGYVSTMGGSGNGLYGLCSTGEWASQKARIRPVICLDPETLYGTTAGKLYIQEKAEGWQNVDNGYDMEISNGNYSEE